MEEERRLLFVGMTRAERVLALSHALSRASYDGPRAAVPSPFLKNLTGLGYGPSALHAQTFDSGRSSAAGAPEPVLGGAFEAGDAAAPSAFGFRVGQRVRHPALGPGRIDSFVREATGPGPSSSSTEVPAHHGPGRGQARALGMIQRGQ